MSETFYNARNLNIENGFVRNPNRYYLEEFFKQRPALNAAVANNTSNKNFEVLGTGMTTELCTFNSNRAAIKITTAGSANDQGIILPHLDPNQTAWTGIKWGTENQIEWECAISLPEINNIKIWAGLKSSNTQVIETNDDQLFFKFQTDKDNSNLETFSEYSKLHFIHSIDGIDYISQLPITVAANTIYRLRISVDSNRKASIFVNDIQYNITTTSGSTGGTAVTTGTTKSASLKNDTDLIPYIGVHAETGDQKALDVYYQKISRVLFE